MNVNNCVESMLGPGYYSDNYGAAIVLSSLLTHTFLLHYIWEKGGAYGASAKANENGVFSFTSFRDPKLLSTFDNFERCLELVCSKEFTENQLDEAKLVSF